MVNKSNNRMDDNDLADLEDLVFPPTLLQPLPHFVDVCQMQMHKFYINGTIDHEITKYLELIHTLKTATEADTVEIFINSEGGSLSTTIQICNAMRASPATVITCIEFEAASAATLIFLSGDEFVVGDDSIFMIHNYSHGVVGKGAKVSQQVKFSEIHFTDIVNRYYANFLNPDELVAVCDDTQDFWFGAEEIKTRTAKVLDARMATFDSEIEELTGMSPIMEDVDPEPTPVL